MKTWIKDCGDNHKVINRHYQDDYCEIHYETDVWTTEKNELDTKITGDIHFWCTGTERENFHKDLLSLIDKYKI